VHALGAELGVGRGATHFVHTLLLKVGLSATGGAALVSAIARNT
jgi:aminoglycoside N3'-acetyltransferase